MLQYVGVMGCLDKEIYLFVDERVAIQGLWFFSLVIGDEAEFGFAAASIAVLHCAVGMFISDVFSFVQNVFSVFSLLIWRYIFKYLSIFCLLYFSFAFRCCFSHQDPVNKRVKLGFFFFFWLLCSFKSHLDTQRPWSLSLSLILLTTQNFLEQPRMTFSLL
ncbi:hypothetical protein I3760_11G147300 [Carya illinoinensis]|nr:hypothetical protein I3760_11G147300 [Carya illinoinensis]